MQITVLRFPGSNCDEDAVHALELLGAEAGARVRLVWHADPLGPTDAVLLPGGFSYGDYLRSGAMAALSPALDEIRAFADRGGPVLGICNGFQVLTEAGLLPGALGRNPGLHFLCREATIRVERGGTAWTPGLRDGDVLRLPIAHNEGSWYAPDDVLERIEGEGRVLLRYAAPDGELREGANPNGSRAAVAGLVNERGNVLGMMPHPERAVEGLLGSEDGRAILLGLIGQAAA